MNDAKKLTHAKKYVRARVKLDCPRGNLKKPGAQLLIYSLGIVLP
jgi:hypothetical protein